MAGMGDAGQGTADPGKPPRNRNRFDGKNLLTVENFKAAVKLGHLGDDFHPRFPDPTQSAVRPLEGEAVIYPDQIYAGLRWPLAPEMVEMLDFYGVSPTQLSNNAIRYWVSFYIYCASKGYGYTLNLFRHFFYTGKSARYDLEYHFANRAGLKIIDDVPSSNSDWRHRWFFYKPLRDNGVPWKWQKIRVADVRPSLSEREADVAARILSDLAPASPDGA